MTYLQGGDGTATDVTDTSTNQAVHGRESNSQPVDYNSDAITTTSQHIST